MSESMVIIFIVVILVGIALAMWVRPKDVQVDPDLVADLPELVYKPVPLASDVQVWIDRDFAKDERGEAIQTLKMSGLDEHCHRCALYVAKGELPELKKAVETGKRDPRDLMMWGEYEDLRQVRDFSKPQNVSRLPAPSPEAPG